MKRPGVVYYQGEFNYSDINNFGAAQAKGEYLLLLNNDTEIINPECLRDALSQSLPAGGRGNCGGAALL